MRSLVHFHEQPAATPEKWLFFSRVGVLTSGLEAEPEAVRSPQPGDLEASGGSGEGVEPETRRPQLSHPAIYSLASIEQDRSIEGCWSFVIGKKDRSLKSRKPELRPFK